jgi:hypothetical protein
MPLNFHSDFSENFLSPEIFEPVDGYTYLAEKFLYLEKFLKF